MLLEILSFSYHIMFLRMGLIVVYLKEDYMSNIDDKFHCI